MREIKDVEEIKDIQLDVLLKIHEFCVNNDIKYSLADGSLIGAVRHGGFIPWDDDIDICMMRDDYNNFIQLFPFMYKEYVSVISMERDLQWAYPFAKAYDVRTIKREPITNNRPEIGIGIDIFPLDEVPDDEEWLRYNKTRKRLFLLFRTKALKISKDRTLFKNIIVLIAKILLSPFSHRRLSIIMDQYSKKNNGKGYNKLFECCLGMILKKPFPKSAFDNVIDITFENHRLKVMGGYDQCLRNYYGDYMQLPPIEKRVTHHSFEAFWK